MNVVHDDDIDRKWLPARKVYTSCIHERKCILYILKLCNLRIATFVLYVYYPNKRNVIYQDSFHSFTNLQWP